LFVFVSFFFNFKEFQVFVQIRKSLAFLPLITKPMMGFKAFHSAQATIAGIEASHMIRKRQLSEENIPSYKQFMALAA